MNFIDFKRYLQRGRMRQQTSPTHTQLSHSGVNKEIYFLIWPLLLLLLLLLHWHCVCLETIIIYPYDAKYPIFWLWRYCFQWKSFSRSPVGSFKGKKPQNDFWELASGMGPVPLEGVKKTVKIFLMGTAIKC